MSAPAPPTEGPARDAAKGARAATPRRSHWGWGHDALRPSGDALATIAESLARRFGTGIPAGAPRAPVPLEEVMLRPSRLRPPAALAPVLTDEPYERCLHHYGRSFRDVVRGSFGSYPTPPDLVAYPEDEAGVAAVLDWCAASEVACIPYGGGSSVVGGVEPVVGDGFSGVVSLDCSRLAGVFELDETSLAARVGAGTFGPDLEESLGTAGLTFRHYPQSFEFSTVGGWIATRSGGHFATRYTHVDDLVESVRMVSPSGVLESRRLPGSGAGPSPDRLVLGSEGALGVITSAWLRVRRRPRFRARASLSFERLDDAVEAVRALSQSGLEPANCRLLDAGEAALGAAGDGRSAIVLIGFESAHLPRGHDLDLALECIRDHGGHLAERHVSGAHEPATGATPSTAWRSSFMSAPYLRDALVLSGAICETFETSITWHRFHHLHQAVLRAAAGAFAEATGGAGSVTCRFTHVYPDGPAPYFTVVAPGAPDATAGPEPLLARWAVIKQACTDAILEAGGSITHHHAIGRDHMAAYEVQRPPLFGAALRAVKATLDPAGVCNPGVLLAPAPSPDI